jgi:hypothetical protein
MSTFSVSDKLKIDKDNASIPTWGIQWAKDGIQFGLAPDTELVVPIPKPYYKCLFNFSVGTNVWVKPDDGVALAVPVVGVPVATVAQLNPTLRIIENDTGLRFISDTSAFVTLSFYNQ